MAQAAVAASAAAAPRLQLPRRSARYAFLSDLSCAAGHAPVEVAAAEAVGEGAAAGGAVAVAPTLPDCL